MLTKKKISSSEASDSNFHETVLSRISIQRNGHSRSVSVINVIDSLAKRTVSNSMKQAFVIFLNTSLNSVKLLLIIYIIQHVL